MTEGDCVPDDEANDEPTLTTLIEGEEARLLVHIETIDGTEAGARTDGEPPPLEE